MEETNFVGICEPKSEHSEFKSRNISDLENDPLKDTNKRREENKRKRNRSKQPKSGSQRRQGKAMKRQGFGFICPQCDKDFPTDGQLKLHEFKVHEGKTPFLCYVCKKKFILKDDLTKHMGESHKRFKCAKCNDSTSSYYNK
jgi:predicted RNA-binding Zn-ribbon protein involved in translation (DUF1610 family)